MIYKTKLIIHHISKINLKNILKMIQQFRCCKYKFTRLDVIPCNILINNNIYVYYNIHT